MKISVIIPNYNDLRIKRSIRSVQNQTYTNFELIIIDGGSKNEELLNFYQTLSCKVIIEKDNGIFDALNKGVSMATGDVIYLMGSDDILSSNDIFENVIHSFDETIDGVCIGCEFFNNNGEIIRKWYPQKVTSKRILNGIMPPHFSLFMRRKIYDKVGLFRFKEDKSIACDTKWLIDLAILVPGLKVKVHSSSCLYMQYGGDSTQSLSRVFKQFLIIHTYAIKQNIPSKWFLSLIRTSSKFFQFQLGNLRKSRLPESLLS
jgi:glycosyltransferase involved in cell wall biosynthesis